MKKLTIAILSLALFAACKTQTKSEGKNTVNLTLTPKSGTKVSGTASFQEKNGKVTFSANIEGLKPGVHAIHIHEKADCSAADFTSAGGHWNPTFKKHGKWGDAEHHKGDIGNFTTDEFGNGKITMTTDQWCIGCGDQTKDILGKAIIVHEKADDYVTQPTGDAGGREACSAIIR